MAHTRFLAIVCAALALCAGAGQTRPLSAQRLVAPALGGVAGAASGGFLTLTIVVAESRAGHYLHDPKDLFGWQSAPVLIGGGTGVALGFLDPGRLVRTVIGGTAGTLLGVATGLVIGRVVWEPPEGKWAGGAIGSGVGLVAGCVIGILWPAPESNNKDSAVARMQVPLGITLHF